MMRLARLLTVLLVPLLLLPGDASAAKRKTAKKIDKETTVNVEEVGVLKNSDIRVVQKNIYAKRLHHEVGFLLSFQPWDAYTAGAMLGLNATLNATESLGVEFTLQGGYGWGNGHFRDINFLGTSAGGTVMGLASDAVRQLLGGNVNLVISPIYAKLAWGGAKVVHFDVYFTLGGHGFLTQRLTIDGGYSGVVGPTVGLGVKFFLSPKVALKLDLKDNIALGTRTYSGVFDARNNVQLGIGLAFYPQTNKGG